MAANGTCIAAGGIFYNVQPGTTADRKYLLKITTKAKLLTSSWSQSTAMQNAEVLMSSPACCNTHVSGRLQYIIFILSVNQLVSLHLTTAI